MTKFEQSGRDFPIEAYEALLTAAFPDVSAEDPVLGVTDDVVIAPDFRTLLSDESMIMASLEKDGELAGFSIAMPVGKMDPERAEEAHTAYIYYTAIEPPKQGQGYVVPLMEDLFKQISERGFAFVERDCEIGNGYADKVERAYADAIIDSYDHTNFAEIGPERFFRIDLGRIAISETE